MTTHESDAKMLDESDDNGTSIAPAARATTGRPSFVSNVITIAGRELRSYFDSLIAYVVIAVTMTAVGGWVFLWESAFWKVDRASMDRMFEMLPWMLSGIVIPGVTMRLLAEEKRSGTLELLITMPVRDAEVILGKYIGAMSMILVVLLGSMLYPLAIFKWPWHLGELDWGPVWTGYLGLVLFSFAGVAIGLFFSSITDNQIIAFFITALVLMVLMAVGLAVESVRGKPGQVLEFISFLSRVTPFRKGMIDPRAILYFVSVAVVFTLLSFRSLEGRKWS